MLKKINVCVCDCYLVACDFVCLFVCCVLHSPLSTILSHSPHQLLELSTSCTPEISSYKEALVLAYDNSSKTIRIKYKELPGISASQETGVYVIVRRYLFSAWGQVRVER